MSFSVLGVHILPPWVGNSVASFLGSSFGKACLAQTKGAAEVLGVDTRSPAAAAAQRNIPIATYTFCMRNSSLLIECRAGQEILVSPLVVVQHLEFWGFHFAVCILTSQFQILSPSLRGNFEAILVGSDPNPLLNPPEQTTAQMLLPRSSKHT